MSVGALAVRGVLGPLFVGHGTQKLFGWFGGHGLEATAGMFENGLGLRPGKRHALLAGAAEAGGGALITAGAATPLGAAAIAATMVTAIRKVHASKGPWVTQQGWEYNAAIIAAMAILTETGPGPLSLDAKWFPNWSGTKWALAILAGAAAGSFIADRPPFNEPAPPEPAAPAPTEAPAAT